MPESRLPEFASTAERNAEIRRLRALPAKERPSLADLALQLGISKERVRQIEAGEHHPDPGDLQYPGGILLRRADEGRFDCYLVNGRVRDALHVGIVVGARGGWTLERADQVPLRAGTLPRLAQRISQELTAARAAA